MSEQDEQIINDATDKVKGFLYQFYTALQYCFELMPGEKLYIEKYGDITVSQLKQIEVKNYSTPLTDAQDNFWNTLNNWCSTSIYSEDYKQLILLTTQQIGKQSKFNGWNDKNADEKMAILIEITNKYCNNRQESISESVKSKIKQMQFLVSKNNRNKLLDILGKFIILDLRPKFSDIYEKIKSIHAKHIPDNKQEEYLNGLLGFVINPRTVENNWEITCETFSQEIQTLTSLYCSGTVVFPKKNKPSEIEINEKVSSLFVRKLLDIEYEDVKNEAICDFLGTNNLLINDFSRYRDSPNILEEYEEELLNSFNPKKRSFMREIANKTDRETIINKSKDFYDAITGEAPQAFLNYNDTPKSFRNGFYHIMADDNEKIDEIVWLLKNTENNDDKTN